MRTILAKWLALACFLSLFTACSDDDTVTPGKPGTQEGTGISDESWTAENPTDAKGGMVIYSFAAAAEWTASSDSEWCEVITEKGGAGECSLRLSLAVNTADQPRTASVTVQLQGYDTPASFKVTQKGYEPHGDGRFEEVNKWMYDYMESHYLWNEPVSSLVLDYSVDYQNFLTQMLDGVAAHDNVNREDGIWQGDKRLSYYTFVQSGAPTGTGTSTLAVGAPVNGTGVFLQRPTRLPDGVVGLAIMAVTPGSPAADAGLQRGDFISKVNGTVLTADNYEQLGKLVYNGPVTVTPNKLDWNGKSYTMIPFEDVSLASARYTDPAIYANSVLSFKDGRKVGYLLYMGFHCDYDRQLMDVFDKFAEAGVSDLILDLRYNNGGDVLAADVLATLIAGNAYKGQILSQFVYNEARTAAGEQGELRIGEKVNVSAPGGYQPIEDALDHALSLRTLYVICSSTTASASEMLINGLRGLDFDVRMIGTTTNGKNVGMEGISRKFYTYDFAFYPVSFYTENAKGFRDYANGLVPDFVLDDYGLYPGDFGTVDDTYCSAAIYWIQNGSMPVLPASREATPLSDWTAKRMERRFGGCIVRPVQEP